MLTLAGRWFAMLCCAIRYATAVREQITAFFGNSSQQQSLGVGEFIACLRLVSQKCARTAAYQQRAASSDLAIDAPAPSKD